MSTETLFTGSRRTQEWCRILFVGTTTAIQSSQKFEFLFQHFPNFLFTNENDEDKNAREYVEDVENVPHDVRATDSERDDLHRPSDAHQNEQTKDDTNPVVLYVHNET